MRRFSPSRWRSAHHRCWPRCSSRYFSSLFASLTHYGTAPGPVIFSGGHVSLYTWWRVGLVVSVLNIAIWLGIGAAWWRLLGLW